MRCGPWTPARGPGIDFTSALYLGLRHPSRALAPWSALTTGAPAALAPSEDADAVARALAALQGAERATLASSTLHLFWDLFRIFASPGTTIHLDAGLYPIARWGAERATARGVRLRRFAHYDPAALRRSFARDSGRLPLVVTDGVCPRCGRPAPLRAYLRVLRPLGGTLVLDDTQALGVLGPGGAGSVRAAGAGGADVLIASSLAKGFGVPVAALAGSAAAVARFEALSETRTHCSPPSTAVLVAARRALAINAVHGDELRRRLAQRVRHFRARLAAAGLRAAGGRFPVQTLHAVAGIGGEQLHAQLLRSGIRTVPLRAGGRSGVRVGFLLTARHPAHHIDVAVATLERLARSRRALEVTYGPDADVRGGTVSRRG